MTNLHKVVEFGATPNAGFTHARAINLCAGTNFHIVFDDDSSGLRDFFPASIRALSVAEAIAADGDVVVNDNPTSKFDLFPDDDMGMKHGVVANPGPVVDDCVSVKSNSVAQNDVFADNHVGANMHFSSQLCRRSDDCRRMYARRWQGRPVKPTGDTGKG
jgi:hypothetical protein